MSVLSSVAANTTLYYKIDAVCVERATLHYRLVFFDLNLLPAN